MNDEEKKYAHPLLLQVLKSAEKVRANFLEGKCEGIGIATLSAAVLDWYKGRPLFTDEAKIMLENVDARRDSLAQEIREGLKVRGLWAPKVSSDLITAIFKAIDEAKTRK